MRMMKRVTFLCSVVLLAAAATARTAAGAQIAGGVAPAGASVGPLHAEDTNDQQQSYDMAFSARLSGAVEARDVATDSQGNVYITGGTGNRKFPTTAGAFQRTLRTGGSSLGREGPYDVFVVKFRSDGKLLWSILLGGPNYDRAYAIEVDSQGNVYVAGRAGDGFPTTPGVVQPVFAGDVHYRSASASHYGKQDGFVAKLSSDGSRLIWASYFGTADQDIIRDMAIDAAGNVYLGVTTTSQPVRHITPDAYQTEPKGGGEAVIAKLSADGTRVLYCSYIGGSGKDGETPSIRVDRSGFAYFFQGTGSKDAPVTPGALQTRYGGGSKDMLLSKLSPDGSSLIYSTYLGGSGYEGIETHGLWVDAVGNAYVVVLTNSPDMPTSATAFQRKYVGASGDKYPWDGYVAKVSADGRKLLAGTYIGGDGREDMEGIAVDALGHVYVSGTTFAADFPVSGRAFQKKHGGGRNDAFFAKLAPDFSRLLYSTFVGGDKYDGGRSLAIDADGGIVLCGDSGSGNWPTKNAFRINKAGDGGAFVARFIPRP